MRIYHASKQIVSKPRFGVGRAYNDFGPGFYCTESKHQAAEHAVSGNTNGFISAYAINTDGLRSIDLCGSQFNVLHWLRVLLDFREFDSDSALLHNAKEYIIRNFYVDYQGSDCISGYSACGASFTLAQDFLNGKLSYQRLRDLLRSYASRQFAIKSNRAFERISYVSYESASCTDYYPAANAKELEMLKAAALPAKKSEFFIDQMIEEEIKSYDARLR